MTNTQTIFIIIIIRVYYVLLLLLSASLYMYLCADIVWVNSSPDVTPWSHSSIDLHTDKITTLL